MTKKKILALVLVVALLLTAIGGTLAYFTDTEEATNVFTVGNVDIELLESKFYTNVDTGKTDDDIRADAKTYAEYLAEAGNLVVPGREFMKAIYIDNTGKNDAWVRVRMFVNRDTFNSFWFYENTTALEKNEITKVIRAYYLDGTTRIMADIAAVKADSNWVQLEYIYTYEKALAAGDLTDRSPVWKFKMKDLDNEDVEGADLGTIKVYADAIQAEGFTSAADAFAAYDKQEGLRYVAASNDALAGVIGKTENDTPVEVELPKGEYTLPTLTGKDVTITGSGDAKDTVIDTVTSKPSTNGAALTFEGVTVDFKAGGSFDTNGFTHSEKVVYKDCIINGTQFLYADAEFINCVFNVEGDAYAVWTYGSANATFTNCIFNTSGKAILVYTEGNHTATVTVSGCTFNCEGAGYGKAAIEVGESGNHNSNGAVSNYTIIIDGCTVNAGFTATSQATWVVDAENGNLGTSTWGNKNLMPADRLHIIIDGEEVY